jgi:hypothetical protein
LTRSQIGQVRGARPIAANPRWDAGTRATASRTRETLERDRLPTPTPEELEQRPAAPSKDPLGKICRIEDPVKYVSILASLMPRDLAIETSKMGELSDEELTALIEHVRETRAKLIEHKPELGLITNGKDKPAG